MSKPEDGWPILEEWACLAKDIFANKYEGFRESVEIKIRNHDIGVGSDLTNFCFEANKGGSRISVLWFGVLWTYLKLKPTLTADMTTEFGRPVGPTNGSKGSSFSHLKSRAPEGEGFIETFVFANTSLNLRGLEMQKPTQMIKF